MPYLNCPGCGLTLYSASAYSTTDDCARCGARLRSVRRPPRLAPPGDVQHALESVRSSVASGAHDLQVDARPEPFGVYAEVTGPLVYPSATRLDAVLDRCEPDTGRLVVDLRAMTDLDSSGLASLMAAYTRSRRQDYDFVVVAPAARYRRLFELTGVDQWLTLVDDLEAATGALPTRRGS